MTQPKRPHKKRRNPRYETRAERIEREWDQRKEQDREWRGKGLPCR